MYNQIMLYLINLVKDIEIGISLSYIQQYIGKLQAVYIYIDLYIY